jgi:hypothetical protein
MSIVLAGGSGPLYAFLAVVIASGLLLLLITFRSGADEALVASSYPDGEAAPSSAAGPDDGRGDTDQGGPSNPHPVGTGSRR